MTNPFMAALGGGQMPGPVGQFQHMMQQFNQFKSNFNGDPKACLLYTSPSPRDCS